MRNERTRLIAWLSAAAGFLLLAALWQLAAWLDGAVSPAAVLAAIVRRRDAFLNDALVSLAEAFCGLTVALVAAFLTATALAMSEAVNRAASPLILASQTVPLVAIAPLLAGVLGSGFVSIVVITAWLCWFPAVIAFIHGLRTVSADQLIVFRVARAGRWQIFRHLRLPGAAPALASGVRASAGFALIGALVAEYSGAKAGLGAAIIRHVAGIEVLANDELIGLVVVCSLLGLLLTWGAHAAARRVLRPWLKHGANAEGDVS